MVTFTQNAAADYDGRIVRLVPGYGLLHELTACTVAALVPADKPADILVAGAGTGRELDDLAARGPNWRFTAMDPSQAMLEAAVSRAEANGYADRLTVHAIEMQAYRTEACHDAAVALLAAQFVVDDGRRAAFLDAMARPLRSGAPLVMVDLAAPADLFEPAYRQWALAQGMDEPAAIAMFKRIAVNFHPIGESRLAEILHDAGCSKPLKFFQALGYCGYVARRN